VVYDSGLHAVVCPHCGSVVEDRPISMLPGRSGDYVIALKHGSYIKSRGVLRFRHMDIVYSSYPSMHRYEKILIMACREFMPVYVCFEAVKVFRRLVEESGVMSIHESRARGYIAASIYAVAKSYRVPISISDVERAVGASDVFSVICRHIDVLRVKRDYEFERDFAFSRVSTIATRVFNDLDKPHEIIKSAREVLPRIMGGQYVYRALAAVYYALRKHGVRGVTWRTSVLCKELGLNRTCPNIVMKLVSKYLKE